MHRNVGIMRGVDRRCRRAMIDEGEPAGIAVCKEVDRRAILPRGYLADQLDAVLADAAAMLRIFSRDVLRDFERAACWIRRGRALAQLTVDRPGEIHRGRPCLTQPRGRS